MEQFYRLNPKKLTRYQPFLNEKAKQTALDADSKAWRHGAYVQAAIGSCLSKNNKYPNQPRMMDQYSVDEENGEVYEVTDADRFWAFASAMNQKKEIKAIDDKIAAERAEMEKSKSADGDKQ